MKSLVLVVALCLAASPSVVSAGAPPRAFQGRPLELSSEEPAERHGMILRAIGRGELDAGAARLAALREQPSASGIAAQIDKDLTRCRALIELRAKHIQELVEKGKRVSLERAQGKIVATVAAFSDGKLTIAGAKSGEKEVAADELLLLPLVREFSSKTLQGVDPSVRGYAFMVAGDAKETVALKGSPQADELRGEAEFYKGALELGAAAELLTRLASRGSPANAASAVESALDLEQLMARFKDYGIVATRRPALASLASDSYQLLYDADKAARDLCAAVEKLPDGRQRLTYDFKKVGEVTDFVADHGYLADVRDQIEGPKVAARDLVIQGGVLKVGGTALWRHVLPFSGPITVTYTYAFDRIDEPPMFIWGVNDDRAGSLVMNWGDMRLMVRDIPTRLVAKSPLPQIRRFVRNQQFTITLAVADGTAYLLENGKELAKVECGSRSQGDLCLIVAGRHDVFFHKLTIEARVDTETLRARWVKQKVTGLGL